MLKVFNEFERKPDLLAKFDKVLTCYSATAVFADVQYRTGVMDSGIKPAFRAKVTGQAVTVQLSKGDLVDPLKALEMGQPGDVIVVDAGGDPAAVITTLADALAGSQRRTGGGVAHLDLDHHRALRFDRPQIAALHLDRAARGGEAGEAVAPGRDLADVGERHGAGGVQLFRRHGLELVAHCASSA